MFLLDKRRQKSVQQDGEMKESGTHDHHNVNLLFGI